MKNRSVVLIVTIMAITAILVSGVPVMAGGGHGGGWGWGYFGLGLATGALLSYPYYYQPYYPYYPYYSYYPSYPYAYAPAYSTSPTVIYREREPAYADEGAYAEPDRARYSSRNTWYYYCKESNAYYPYVRICPGGWGKVPAVPPSEPGSDR